jgi:COMPASS component SWD1
MPFSAQLQNSSFLCPFVLSALGAYIKTLEGPKKGLCDVVWHPTRPIVVSISGDGVIYIWTVNYQVRMPCGRCAFYLHGDVLSPHILNGSHLFKENWSAFAPDFKEVEENVEYVEREDEFDDVRF